jgi:Ni/Co efflux regulator RcnB
VLILELKLEDVMNNVSKSVGLAVALVFLSTSPVIAKNPDNQGKSNAQGNSNSNGNSNSQKGNSKNKDHQPEMHYAGINQKDAQRYASQYHVGSNKPLPPGIRKNLARGKPIPPGIAMTRLPSGYVNQLPRYNGYEWRGYGSDLVLVNSTNQLIADVIMDVLR